MNQYVSKEELPAVKADTDFLEYPNALSNAREFLGEMAWGAHASESGEGFVKAKPSELLVDSLHHIGREPKTVLDIGCEAGRHGLLLAELGHFVIAVDPDPVNLEYIREQARTRGIPDKNFVPRQAKLEELRGDEKYQVVLAMMVMHHLDPVDILAAAQTVQLVSAKGGLNIANAYTRDNPEEEMQGRGLKYMFSAGEFGRLMIGPGATVIRNQEGVLKTPKAREFHNNDFLFPSVSEVVTRKA